MQPFKERYSHLSVDKNDCIRIFSDALCNSPSSNKLSKREIFSLKSKSLKGSRNCPSLNAKRQSGEAVELRNNQFAETLKKERQSLSEVVYSVKSSWLSKPNRMRGGEKFKLFPKLAASTDCKQVKTNKKMIESVSKVQNANKVDGSTSRKQEWINRAQMEMRSRKTQHFVNIFCEYENNIRPQYEMYNFDAPAATKRAEKLEAIKNEFQKKIGRQGVAFQEKQFSNMAVLMSEQELLIKKNENKRESIPGQLKNAEEGSAISYRGKGRMREGVKSREQFLAERNKERTLRAIQNNEKELSIYELKMKHYRQFLFMMNIAHRKFDSLLLRDVPTLKADQKVRYYIGDGNNNLLIRSLLNRRFWFTPETDPAKAHFVWTQLKLNELYQYQPKAQPIGYSKVEGQTNQNTLKDKAGKDKIFTEVDTKIYANFESALTAENVQKMSKFSNRLKYFENVTPRREGSPEGSKMHNHFECNFHLGNKKALFYNLRQYYSLRQTDVFNVVPLTFHIQTGLEDLELKKFQQQFEKIRGSKSKSKNVWIVKPGEISNRGNGITVINRINQLTAILKKGERHCDGTPKTYIVQKYIEKPLLYKGRKFDIRHYMLVSRLHGLMRGYWFQEGYIRTSSCDYDIDDVGNDMVHLTNDAIQKNSMLYGKHEEGNKLSYAEFQKYLDSKYPEEKYNFQEQVISKMKEVAVDALKSSFFHLDPSRHQHNFQIFGLDFMVDRNMKVWLIEINTNPCLELSSKLLSRIIPTMVEHSLKLTLDVLFPPPIHYPNSVKYLAPDDPLLKLKYQLIFDEAREAQDLRKLYHEVSAVELGTIRDDEEVFENEGRQIELAADFMT